ncbi:class I SAM-dependent methyltransferase [Vibrio cholerae]|uniref:class I SAM-dependent methyltransferase n=1 Tax=Vibrio cholerae TaxID=666 RepID=UPI001C2F4A5D|nr:class I SAM-dependent methyltransferase [Vibrio cholerae]
MINNSDTLITPNYAVKFSAKKGNVLKKLSNKIIETCGYGKVLEIGCANSGLVEELLNKGVNAFGFFDFKLNQVPNKSNLSGRFKNGSITSLPFENEEFDTVISAGAIEKCDYQDIGTVFSELNRVVKKYLFLQIDTIGNGTIEKNRHWWENKTFEYGFRKHPAYYRLCPYESLNEEPTKIFVLLEKIPQPAIEKYSIEELNKQRVLHMDMLREIGRRGDAHCIRYLKAAEFVRPGDTVLDLACGLGYGSHIIYHNSLAKRVIGMDLSESGIEYAQYNYQIEGRIEFQLADAQNIENLPDNSVDFITTFETIEHLPEPKKYLAELERVLRPSGRMLICAPNDWADETGEDPNPYHFHVYTWEKLKRECGEHFILDKGFVQTAGGAMKCHHSPRSWHEVAIEGFEQEAEWILLLCVKDPLKGSSVEYQETQWELPQSEQFNVVNFGRDYENPWIVRGVVTRGQRLLNPEKLLQKQLQILHDMDEKTVDYAAALCGYAYSLLEKDTSNEVEVSQVLGKIDTILKLREPGAHHLRWNVSLAFVAGELCKMLGRTECALQYFEYCTRLDVLEYSPLLGNKTLDAYFKIALIQIGFGNIDLAREALAKSVKEVNRLAGTGTLNIIGSEQAPCAFGYAEMAQLFDKASRAVYMLDIFDSLPDRPELIAMESKGFFERIVADKCNIINDQQQMISNLYGEVERLNQTIALITAGQLHTLRSLPYRALRYVYRKLKAVAK